MRSEGWVGIQGCSSRPARASAHWGAPLDGRPGDRGGSLRAAEWRGGRAHHCLRGVRGCDARGVAGRGRAVRARGIVGDACVRRAGRVVGGVRRDSLRCARACERACVRRATREPRRAGGECMAVSLGGSEIRRRRLPYAHSLRRRGALMSETVRIFLNPLNPCDAACADSLLDGDGLGGCGLWWRCGCVCAMLSVCPCPRFAPRINPPRTKKGS